MLRSERSERLEAWAAGTSPVATLRSAADDGAASAWLRQRAVLVAADRAVGGGAGGLHDDRGGRSAGLPYDQRVPAASSEGACGALRAGVEACRAGGLGEAGPCGSGRHQDQGQCVQAQGDEL